MKHVFIHHEDSAHSWLAVPRSLLEELGIAGEITRYSYRKGETVYLEEDCDWTRFDAAMKAKGAEYRTVNVYHDGYHPIRNYQRWGQ